MNVRQMEQALRKAMEAYPSDEELDKITEVVKAAELIDNDEEVGPLAMLIGFVVGYDCGRREGNVIVSPMADRANWPEHWRNGDPAKTGVYVGA